MCQGVCLAEPWLHQILIRSRRLLNVLPYEAEVFSCFGKMNWAALWQQVEGEKLSGKLTIGCWPMWDGRSAGAAWVGGNGHELVIGAVRGWRPLASS